MRADLDGDFPVEPLQKIQQLVSSEPAVMAVHQMGHLGLRNAKEFGDLRLFELPSLNDPIDAKANLRTRKKLVRVLAAKIGKDIAAAFFNFRFFLFSHFASSSWAAKIVR